MVVEDALRTTVHKQLEATSTMYLLLLLVMSDARCCLPNSYCQLPEFQMPKLYYLFVDKCIEVIG